MSKASSVPSPAPGGGAGVGRAAWVGQQRGRKAVLYVVKVYSADESFYKVGVTFSLAQRFSRLKTLYKWRTVARYSSWNAAKVWDLEQRIHSTFTHLSYTPTAYFAGRTECYITAESILEALPADTFFLKSVNDIL